MNNIEILEELLKERFEAMCPLEAKAIENLIQENKELKEEIKAYEKQLDYVKKYYISKSKADDLIVDYSVTKGRNERVINYKYFEPFLEELGKLLEE